jgi:signal transduction histidine kinase
MQVSTKDIIIAVIAITIIFSLAAAFLVQYVNLYNERKKKHLEEKRHMEREFENQLMQSQLEVQEYTFSMLSEELHDNIGQLLTSTKMLLNVTERNLSQPPDSLKTASETLSKAILDLRSLSKSLNEEWLHQFNLIENLHSEVDRLHASRQIALRVETKIYMLPLEPKEQVMLFRIVQEALQNSIKHAHASTISIAIECGDGSIGLLITDDGQGFEPEKTPSSGVGIRNMKHRIHLLHGHIEWDSAPDRGTRVSITLPYQNHTP